MAVRYRAIARVEKAHGRFGEVVARKRGDLLAMLEPGMQVHVVPPEIKEPRTLVVRDVQSFELKGGTSADGQLVSFVGIEDMSSAERLVGKTLLVDRVCLGQSDQAQGDLVAAQYGTSVVGRLCVHEDGRALGVIKDIIETPAQRVWDIESPTGERWMVPVVPQFVVELPKSGDIVLSPLEGLLPESLQTKENSDAL